jgi:hypothetical protein
MKTTTVAQAIARSLNTRKRGITAKELQRVTGCHPKTIRNNLGLMITEGTVSWEEYLRTCKVSGHRVTAYTTM